MQRWRFKEWFILLRTDLIDLDSNPAGYVSFFHILLNLALVKDDRARLTYRCTMHTAYIDSKVVGSDCPIRF